MHPVSASSVDQLRHDSERARQNLASTVNELRDKVGDAATEIKTLVSPAHIKEELKSYIREERESISQSVQRKIKDNPLQAAAVGAALAYPMLGLLRSIPAPILLIGAGLWLSGANGRKQLDRAKSAVADATEKAVESISTSAAPLQSAIEEAAGQASTSIHRTAGTIADNASALLEKGRNLAGEVSASMTASAEEAAAAAAGTAAGVVQSANAGVEDVKNRASQLGGKARHAVQELAERNPLLLAGVGAAVGAMIAASLPRSDAEARLFASAANDLKDKANDFAAQGLTKAKAFVADAVRDAAEAASREGLGEERVKEATRSVVDGAKSVAERAMHAAVNGVQSRSA